MGCYIDNLDFTSLNEAYEQAEKDLAYINTWLNESYKLRDTYYNDNYEMLMFLAKQKERIKAGLVVNDDEEQNLFIGE